jgi:hypothetical protein
MNVGLFAEVPGHIVISTKAFLDASANVIDAGDGDGDGDICPAFCMPPPAEGYVLETVSNHILYVLPDVDVPHISSYK